MTTSQNLGCDCRGWRIAYNSLLNLHAKTGSAKLAESVYQEMLVQGPVPDKNSINSTIAAFAAVRKPTSSEPAATQRQSTSAFRAYNATVLAMQCKHVVQSYHKGVTYVGGRHRCSI